MMLSKGNGSKYYILRKATHMADEDRSQVIHMCLAISNSGGILDDFMSLGTVEILVTREATGRRFTS